MGTLPPPTTPDRVAVEINAITKKFGSVLALDELSIGLRDKNFVSIVGPSGCGKSTLLRMVAGLVRPTSGSISVHGKLVTQPIQDVGMVFQAPVLLPWRTTLSNILFVAEMRGENQRLYLDRARQLTEVAGLSGFEKSYPHELSGGMQQRVAICRALLMDPKLILMDEPFGALDIITRERMAFELQKIWSANRNTVIFVTHSVSEAVLLSDTVIVMTSRPGRISDVVEVDLPRPRNRETLVDKRFMELSTRVRNNIAAGWAE